MEFWQLSVTTGLIAIFLYALYKWSRYNFDYWEKRKVFYIEPTAFIGNYLPVMLMRTTIGEHFAKLYFQVKNQPYFGMWVWNQPYLVVQDLDLLKAICIKDFDYFLDHNILKTDYEPLTGNILFTNKGAAWKTMRSKMRPFFSSGKLKVMAGQMNQLAKRLCSYIDEHVPHDQIECKELCAKYSTDVITSCAYSIRAKSFDTDDAEFRILGRQMFGFSYSIGIQQNCLFFARGLAKALRMQLVPSTVTNFLKTVLWDVIHTREKAGNFNENDVLGIITQLRRDEAFCKKMDFYGDKVLSLGVQMFLAGFETTSSIMSYALYELCIHPHIQTKVRDEILKTIAKHDGDITYDAIEEMKYLDMCFCETLRKYPTLPFLDRICTKDYTIPGTDVVLEKGVGVIIPLFGFHYDPQYFPNPHKFNPERYADYSGAQHLMSFMPFGHGPRRCIGDRFGTMAAKIGVANVLANFELEKVDKTPIPIHFDPKSLVLNPKGGLPLKFKKLTIDRTLLTS